LSLMADPSPNPVSNLMFPRCKIPNLVNASYDVSLPATILKTESCSSLEKFMMSIALSKNFKTWDQNRTQQQTPNSSLSSKVFTV
jgi:hypothetical protein